MPRRSSSKEAPSRWSPPRRGLSREEAALYIGISASKFDMLVDDGRMPKPRQIDRRKVWDIRALDLAFEALPGGDNENEPNPWDEVLSGPRSMQAAQQPAEPGMNPKGSTSP